MALTAGQRLGTFEIVGSLGAGGMGEVYRARDTRLKRDVAIKVLPEAFARDPDRIARFQREAELLATLNHPNIASVYGLEDVGSADDERRPDLAYAAVVDRVPPVNVAQGGPAVALVMELVEGPTLSDRIAQGPIPIDEALSIARQVSAALEAAHDKDIVHRDLKPANVKIAPGGRVKVLDFGLAKAMESASIPEAVLSMSPTMVSPATQAGIILGTAAYMSPEQARGKTVDQRADIWAFGCVLFEMLTGRPPFDPGETVSDAIAAILTRDPDWSALPATTPAPIRRLLRRCLQRDPDRRLHDVADARLELEDTDGPESQVQTATAAVGSRWKTGVPWVIAVSALTLALFTLWFGRPNSPATVASVTRLEFVAPSDIELYSTTRTISLSPDGSHLAFIGVQSGARSVYVRRLDQYEVTRLRGTDAASACFFSADGTSIGFITSSGVLKTITLADGVLTTLAEVSFLNGAAWSTDGTIVVSRGDTLWGIPRAGGTPKPLTTLDAKRQESRHAWPVVLPDGKTMLFAVASNDRWHIEAADLNTGERHTILDNGTLPLYTTAGHLAFFRDGRMFAAPFDAAAVEITGPPVQLLDNLPTLTSGIPLIDISLSGTLAYSSSTAINRLAWVSRRGEEEILNADGRSYSNPRMSPDGQRIIVQAGDLWMQDLARGTFSRLTTGEVLSNGFPIWLPDGQVMYRSPKGLRMQQTGGPGGPAQVIPGTTELDYPGAVARDGDTLVFQRSSESSQFDILALSLRDPSKVRPLVQTPAYESSGGLLPDGRWLSYVSNETGRNEVYVTPFPGPGERVQVSTQGGTQPLWNPSGNELFYRIDDKMMVVDVTSGPALKLSPPKMLFEARYAYGAGITIPNYDVSRDGQRFIMVKPESGAGRLNVVLNWFANRK